ncbi:MAG: hypothetical protein HGB11_07445 [Chlorobiales bacterium]|nr:hypothetical protein [Chlorobiales bacterium]
MHRPEITPEDLIERLDKGERLGIDEAIRILETSDKLFSKKVETTFFNAARAVAQKKPPLRIFLCPRFKTGDASAEGILEQVNRTVADMIYLNFSDSVTLERAEEIIREISAVCHVSAFSPHELLHLSDSTCLKVHELCRHIALAGLSAVPGTLTAKAKDLLAIDEYFSVLMQLSKVKVRSSIQLPMSFSSEEKVHHLAKIREFEDRTRTLNHFVLLLDKGYSDKELLRTIALCRIMLDNIDYISLVDYNLDQTARINPSLLSECVSLGINMTGPTTS